MQDGRKRTDLTIAAPLEQDRAGDPLGAVIPLRDRETPKENPASDLSNVIPFVRRKRGKGDKAAPALALDPAERPAPGAATLERQRQITLLIAASIFIHGALFAAFNREPEAHASIGVISVSAEIVLGAQSNAGLSQTPSESDVASAAAPEPLQKPVDEPPETARKLPETLKPVEQPTEDTSAQSPSAPKAIVSESPPRESGELVIEKKPVEKPEPQKKLREAARHTREDGESHRTRSAPASAPSASSNSIGRGRSDADTNYRGIVAAHLARHKQFPADARSRGQQGAATVTFSISGSGSVTSVRLSRSSGYASIDQETQSMVRRASPFPAPPGGRAMSFSVPVSFYLR